MSQVCCSASVLLIGLRHHDGCQVIFDSPRATLVYFIHIRMKWYILIELKTYRNISVNNQCGISILPCFELFPLHNSLLGIYDNWWIQRKYGLLSRILLHLKRCSIFAVHVKISLLNENTGWDFFLSFFFVAIQKIIGDKDLATLLTAKIHASGSLVTRAVFFPCC